MFTEFFKIIKRLQEGGKKKKAQIFKIILWSKDT